MWENDFKSINSFQYPVKPLKNLASLSAFLDCNCPCHSNGIINKKCINSKQIRPPYMFSFLATPMDGYFQVKGAFVSYFFSAGSVIHMLKQFAFCCVKKIN